MRIQGGQKIARQVAVSELERTNPKSPATAERVQSVSVRLQG